MSAIAKIPRTAEVYTKQQTDNAIRNSVKPIKRDVESLLFAKYYPEGNVKSAAEFTAGIKYDDPDTSNRTITVKPFCYTSIPGGDNSGLVGRVVIPPFVDASGNGYISDDGTRYKVVGVSGGQPNGGNFMLTTIVAPNTVTSIGDDAFAYCAATTSVSLPAATSIGNEAFITCEELTSVDFGDTPRPSVPTLGESAFYGVPTSCKIIVPYTQYDAWKAAENWRDLQQEFVRHAEKADKPATFTTGNLAKFDAQGNPTDSGKKPSDFQSALTSQQLANIAAVSDALAFDATHSYAVGDPVVYNGTLYTFTAEHTGAWTGSDVSAVNIIARLAGKLDKSGGTMTGPLTEKHGLVLGKEYGNDFDGFRVDASGNAEMTSHAGGSAMIGAIISAVQDVPNKANRVANPTAGNLAALDASGNPTDSGVKASDKLDSTSAAPAFSSDSSTQYAVGSHVTYNGKLYKCTTATTGGTWDASKWTADTASNYFQYALVTKTIDNGAVTLDDHAMNAVAVSSALASLTINFPTATSGRVRDFGLRLSVASGITTAPELVLPQGITCENADGEVPEIGADGAATILYFTETASGVFLVKGEVVTAIS